MTDSRPPLVDRHVSERFRNLANRRSIADDRAIAVALSAVDPTDVSRAKNEAMNILKVALERGRREVAERLRSHPSRGLAIAAAQAYLIDVLVRALFDFATKRLYPHTPTTGNVRITVIAIGGYGRAEMAPHSDVDIGILVSGEQSPRIKHVIETILYTLWDLGLKLGYSIRTIDDMIAMAVSDITARTALLEARYICGDENLYDEAAGRFKRKVQDHSHRQFIADKLTERDERHHRMGDTRYVVEPNVKEGKGGLRDLHALFWIGKYIHDVRRAAELVDVGLFSSAEYRQFNRADNFLWAVRCHLHIITGRAEDRLTFDTQKEIARRMRFSERQGKSRVERFMQYYFLQAKGVGTLTGVFVAHLDEKFAARGARFGLPTIRRRPRKLAGFVLDRGRLALPSADFLAQDPVRLIEIFVLADRYGLEIHPLAVRAVARDVKLIDSYRDDPRANALFMNLLTSRREPELVLRWMNEAGVIGRFISDFGRIVAQMQFDMYHHYTVDEHTIRAVGLLAQIEKGALIEDHPIASVVVNQIVSHRVLRLAVLFHDIAKGRRGDHSVLGAQVAQSLCPRLGLSGAETETVVWLVRHHLLMSATAFKRDLSDPKTITDFCAVVQSAERLRLLLILTIVDIRAVGPAIWNGWKRQLIGDLFEASEEVLRLGHKQRGRSETVTAKQAQLATTPGWTGVSHAALIERMPEAYWIAEPDDVIAHNARLIARSGDAQLAIDTQIDRDRGATLITIYAGDQPGLFYRIAGAIHLAGGNIIDARIHTTHDGMAVDNFLVQDPLNRPFDGTEQLSRLRKSIEDALADRGRSPAKLIAKPSSRTRAEAFDIHPNVLIDNHASNRFTVIEVNARDRPALLHQLAENLFRSNVMLHSAHIATYGERAVDTFYVTDIAGEKITALPRLKLIEKRLLEPAAANVQTRAA